MLGGGREVFQSNVARARRVTSLPPSWSKQIRFIIYTNARILSFRSEATWWRAIVSFPAHPPVAKQP
jgi:hypothetical protein